MAKKKNEAEINASEASVEVAADKKNAGFNKRKLKYGSIAAAITIIVIAIVVLVNVIVNMASDKGNMSIDLTTNDNFDISQ